MKGLAATILIGIMGLATLSITMDNNSVTDRKAELEESLTSSMRNTVKGTNVYQMYDINNNEMSVELIRNLAENANTDSTLDVYVYETSTKGVMDIELEGSFTHLNGEDGSRSTRKTLLLETVPAELN